MTAFLRSVKTSGLKTVADADFRLDMARLRGIGFNFLAQMADIDAQVFVVVGGLAAPDLDQQLPMRQHPARIAGHRQQQPVFDLGQLDRLAGLADRAIDAVDRELAEPDQRIALQALRRRAPKRSGSAPPTSRESRG